MAEEEMILPPEPKFQYAQVPQTGDLSFILAADRSDTWKEQFVRRWDRKRKEYENTHSPLGEARITGRHILIKLIHSDMLGWHSDLAVELLERLDGELNEP
jgi:hypothetical protein